MNLSAHLILCNSFFLLLQRTIVEVFFLININGTVLLNFALSSATMSWVNGITITVKNTFITVTKNPHIYCFSFHAFFYCPLFYCMHAVAHRRGSSHTCLNLKWQELNDPNSSAIRRKSSWKCTDNYKKFPVWLSNLRELKHSIVGDIQ